MSINIVLHSQAIARIAKHIVNPGMIKIEYYHDTKMIEVFDFDPSDMKWKFVAIESAQYVKPTRERNKKGATEATPSDNDTKIDDPRQETLPSPPSDQPPVSSEEDQTLPNKNARVRR